MVNTEIRLIIFFAAKDREALYSQKKKKRLWSDCSSDHQLCIAKFRLILKKVWKSTRPFSCDLNQIPYNYTVEVTSRFKGWDLIECLMNYGWRFMTLYRTAVIKTIPKKKKCTKAKWLSEEAMQISEKRREAKGKWKKGKIYPFECRVPKNSKEK